MSVNMEDLKIAFELLGFGWGGVFVVLFIIYLSSKLLTKLFTIKKAYHKVGLNIYISSIIYSRYFLHPEETFSIIGRSPDLASSYFSSSHKIHLVHFTVI